MHLVTTDTGQMTKCGLSVLACGPYTAHEPHVTCAGCSDRVARECVEDAIDHLRQARELLKRAKAPRTAERVRLALTSAQGALRNVESRPYRDSRGTR